MDREYRLFGTTQTMSGPMVPVWMCPDDGDFVLDTSIHNRWHDECEAHGCIGTIWRLRNFLRKPVI